MSESKISEKETIKSEFRAYTKADITQALSEQGITVTGREKKEELLDLLAEYVLKTKLAAEGEISPVESEKEKKGISARDNGKERAVTKKTGRKKALRENVPEITKDRRLNVSELTKAKAEATESDSSKAKAYGEDVEYRPRQIRNAPESLGINGPKRKNDELEEDFELAESFNTPGLILKGRLHMVITDRTPWVKKNNPLTKTEGMYYQAAAVIKYYSRFVFIPAEYFFEDYWKMDQSKLRTFLEERVGAEVEFRVISVNRENPKNPIYIGSRIAAMIKNRCDYWYSEREKGRALLEVGSIHEAKIVAVSRQMVFVEMYGAEIGILEKDVTWNRIKDLRYKFFVGDIVDVMIKSVTLQDRSRAEALSYPVDCRLSIKEAAPDPRDKYFVQDLKNARFKGIIRDKEIDKNNITWYWVEMGVGDSYEDGGDEGLTIRCRLGDKVKVIPMVDDIASGKITFPNDKQKRVFGTIYHIDPPRPKRFRR